MGNARITNLCYLGTPLLPRNSAQQKFAGDPSSCGPAPGGDKKGSSLNKHGTFGQKNSWTFNIKPRMNINIRINQKKRLTVEDIKIIKRRYFKQKEEFKYNRIKVEYI